MKLFFSVLITVLLLTLGCSRKYLTFFFDGVPSEEKESSLPIDSVTTEKPVIEVEKQYPLQQRKNEIKALSIHPPYQKKECGKCHLEQQGFRLKEMEPMLCNQCHKDFSTATPFVHGPVAAGFCNACHLPHKSNNKKLLVLPVREICQHCHEAGDINKNKAHEKTSKIPCLECHYAHGGQTILMLKNNETIK